MKLTCCVLFWLSTSAFEIAFWVPFAALRWSEIIKERMPAYLIDTGAAIWIRRVSKNCKTASSDSRLPSLL